MQNIISAAWRYYSYSVTNQQFWPDVTALITELHSRPKIRSPDVHATVRKIAEAWLNRHPRVDRPRDEVVGGIVSEIMKDGASLLPAGEGRTIHHWLTASKASWHHSNYTEALGPITLNREHFRFDRAPRSSINFLFIDRRIMYNDGNRATTLGVKIAEELTLQFDSVTDHEKRVLFVCGGDHSGKTHGVISTHSPSTIVLYATQSDVKNFVEEQTSRTDISDAEADDFFLQPDGSRRCGYAVAFVRWMARVVVERLQCGWSGYSRRADPSSFDTQALIRSTLLQVTLVIDDVGCMPNFCRAVAGASETIRDVIRSFLRVHRVAVVVVGAGVEMAALGLPADEVSILNAETNLMINKDPYYHLPVLHDAGVWNTCFNALMTNTQVAVRVYRQVNAYKKVCDDNGITPQSDPLVIAACITAVAECVPGGVSHHELNAAIGKALAIGLFAEHDLDAEEAPLVIKFGMLVDTKSLEGSRPVPGFPRYHISEVRAAMMCLEYGYRREPSTVLPFPQLVSWWLRLGLRGSAWYFHRHPIPPSDYPRSRVLRSMGDLLREINQHFPSASPDRLVDQIELETTLGNATTVKQLKTLADARHKPTDTTWAAMIHNVRFASGVVAFHEGCFLHSDHAPWRHCSRLQVFADFYWMGAVNFATRLAALLVVSPAGSDSLSSLAFAAGAPDCNDPEQLWERIHDAPDAVKHTIDAVIATSFGLQKDPDAYLRSVAESWYGASVALRHMFAVICCLPHPLSARDVSLLPQECYVVTPDRCSGLHPAVVR